MTMYFRLLRLILTTWFMEPRDAFKTYQLDYRALPLDCDINRHVTNSKYYAFMDLGRIHLMASSGLLQEAMKRQWFQVLSATHMTFIKPIAFWKKFELNSRILCWDNKYCYFEHRFEAEGKVLAIGLCRGAFIYKGKPVAPEEIYATTKQQPPSLESPEVIDIWQHLLQQQKQAMQNDDR